MGQALWRCVCACAGADLRPSQPCWPVWPGAWRAKGQRRPTDRRRLCATPGSTRTSTRLWSTRATSRSPRSTRFGPTARRSAAGFRCRPEPPSTGPIPTPGSSRSGTRFWKEFSFAGRRVETRLLERLTDGQWRYAAYEWSADGRDARLAPGTGQARRLPARRRQGPRDPERQRLPGLPRGVADCGARVQPAPALARPRSRRAACRGPARAGRRSRLPDRRAAFWSDFPTRSCGRRRGSRPRRAAERAALGYLHGNCGHCHNAGRQASQRRAVPAARAGPAEEPGIASTVGQPVKDAAPGQTPGRPASDRPGASRTQRARRASRLALRGAADAAARHRAGGPGGRRTGPAMDREPG